MLHLKTIFNYTCVISLPKKKLNNLRNANFYKLELRNNLPINYIKKTKAKFKPIPFILTFGLLHHKFAKGKKVELYFTHYLDESKIKLVYLKSTSDCSLHSLHKIINELEEFCKQHNVKEIKTLVVNPYLSKNIMEKYGWIYVKSKMFIGKLYEKKLNQN